MLSEDKSGQISLQPSRASEGLQPSTNVASFPSVNNVAVSSHETVKFLKVDQSGWTGLRSIALNCFVISGIAQ
jgi:hypothetical protein